MKKPITKSNLSSLAPFLLFVIFTACILSVLLTGADVYQKISQRDQINYQKRTTAQYLTTRIRQSDVNGMIFVGNFDGDISQSNGDTLFLCEEIEGRTFYTRIYCHDGYMYELFAEAGLSFSPSAGVKILEANHLQFTIQDNLLYIEIEYKDSDIETITLQLRSNKEVSS